jgi:RimJ/RimL family protein N-acetyltransferase
MIRGGLFVCIRDCCALVSFLRAPPSHLEIMGILSRMLRGTRWERLALPVIETGRLAIAPLHADMAEEVRRLTDDPAVTSAVDFLPERFALSDARGLIRAASTGRDVFLGLVEREDRSLVGICGAHLRALEAIEIGYWIGGAARGQGYGAEGVGAVVAALAGAYPRRAIVAECRPENVASWQMLHKLGFRPTGDSGKRPGRQLMVWDIRDAPQGRPAASEMAASRAAARPDGAL